MMHTELIPMVLARGATHTNVTSLIVPEKQRNETQDDPCRINFFSCGTWQNKSHCISDYPLTPWPSIGHSSSPLLVQIKLFNASSARTSNGKFSIGRPVATLRVH